MNDLLTQNHMDFSVFFLICIILLAVLIFCCLLRAIRGPKIADRIMASNMIGTLTVAAILLLSVYIDESYIIDVCLVYAVISFLAVIVIAKIYIGIFRQHHRQLHSRSMDSFGSLYELRTEQQMAAQTGARAEADETGAGAAPGPGSGRTERDGQGLTQAVSAADEEKACICAAPSPESTPQTAPGEEEEQV